VIHTLPTALVLCHHIVINNTKTTSLSKKSVAIFNKILLLPIQKKKTTIVLPPLLNNLRSLNHLFEQEKDIRPPLSDAGAEYLFYFYL
jgi:hypothetical protein